MIIYMMVSLFMKKMGFFSALFLLALQLSGGYPCLAQGPNSKEVEITVKLSSKGNDIAFDQNAIQVPFGKTVKMLFTNQALSDSAITHNVAVLQLGKEADVIKSLQSNGYDLSKLDKSLILAQTKVLNPGEKDTIVFRPAAPGIYTYMCLMPGHGDMLGMKGQLNVVK